MVFKIKSFKYKVKRMERILFRNMVLWEWWELVLVVGIVLMKVFMFVLLKRMNLWGFILVK